MKGTHSNATRKQSTPQQEVQTMRLITTLAAVGAVGILATGCMTGRRSVTLDPVPDAVRYTEPVTFARTIEAPWDAVVRDDNNPQEQIAFAISLSTRGRHVLAGDFFVQDAERFKSRGREFEVSCLAAGANEYLKGGDLDKFRATVRQLRSVANRYQIAGAGPELSALLSLGDIASGEATPSEWTPKALKPFYSMSGNNQLAQPIQ